MKALNDDKTIDMLGLPRRRGRPSGSKPALTGAERVANLRRRRLQEGLVSVSFFLPVDVVAALDEFVRFKDVSKDDVVARIVRREIMRKR